MIRKTKTRKIIHLHIFLTVSVLAAYLVLGMAFGVDFLEKDIRQKARVLGSTVSAMVRVFGTPNKPEAEVSVGCNESEAPYVYLNWDEDEDATAFDIYRGGAELMLDVADNFYTDTNVTAGSDYEYYVIARGPGGISDASDSVSANVGSCPILEYEGVSVTVFDGRNVSGWTNPSSEDRTPVFAGTTSIPNADIDIYLDDENQIYAATEANSTGFWQWTVPVNLSYGSHILYLTSTDPLNPAISYSGNFSFRITEEDEDDDEDDEDDDDEETSSTGTISTPTTPAKKTPDQITEKPFDFNVNIKSQDLVEGVSVGEQIFKGDGFEIIIDIGDTEDVIDPVEIIYEIVSSDGKTVEKFSEKAYIKELKSVNKNMNISENWPSGKYKLRVSIVYGKAIINRDSYFEIKDHPLADLGSGIITKVDIISNLGWLLVLCLIILLIISGMVIWEHHLANGALFHVTERFLKGKGYID